MNPEQWLFLGFLAYISIALTLMCTIGWHDRDWLAVVGSVMLVLLVIVGIVAAFIELGGTS